MSDPTTLATLFKSTLSESNQNIKTAQKTLSQLQSDPNFLPHLLIIAKQITLSKNIRHAAAIYTRQYAKSILSQKNKQKMNVLIQSLIHELQPSTTQLMIRKHFASTLQFLLLHDQNQTIRQTLNMHCIKILQLAKSQSDINVNFQFIAIFTQVLMSSFLYLTKQINNFIQNSISTFVSLNIRLFKYVIQAITQGNKQKIIHIFKILKIYSYTLKLYLKSMITAEIPTVKLLYEDNLTILINISFNFVLNNNQLSTTLIYHNSTANDQMVDLFHFIKADYIQSVFSLMRTIFLQFADTKMVQANAILNNAALVPSLINSLNELFIKIPYNNIQHLSLIKQIQQIIKCSIISVRNIFYFSPYQQYKHIIIHGIILKILAFTAVDYQTLINDPNQYINQLLQIIQMNSEKFFKQKTNSDLFFFNQSIFQQDCIEQFSTLRTLTATFFEAYCKHIDGSLTQIVNFSIGVLKNEINSDFSKSLILLMISILKDLILPRQSENCQIVVIVSKLLKNKQIPTRTTEPDQMSVAQYEANIEYLMLLLTIFRYLPSVKEVDNNQIFILYQVVQNIITKDNVSQSIYYQAFDITMCIAERQPGCLIKFIEILNSTLLKNENANDRDKILQNLQNLFKLNCQCLGNNLQLVIKTVQNLSNIVQWQVKKNNQANKLVVNRCWNVISDICQNTIFIPKLIPQIQTLIMPLLQYINQKNNFDYQQNILLLMSSFISKSQAVTKNQLTMLEIIPNLFYNQYKHRFGHAFETLHIFIQYGSNILATAHQAIKAIVDMTVCSMNAVMIDDKPRNEAENCEGVLILQSLILSCGNSFSTDNWVQIAKALTNRLECPPVKGNILRSNILAALALVVMIGYKHFSNDDCSIMLNRVIQNCYCFVVKYSVEVAIIALSEIFSLYNLQFVSNRLTSILQTILNLLQSRQNKQFFNKNPMTQEQKDYDILLQTTFNMSKNIDEVDYFKLKFTIIKQQNLSLLQKTLNQLSSNKMQYLKKIMNVQKVMNENRVIFKIKK